MYDPNNAVTRLWKLRIRFFEIKFYKCLRFLARIANTYKSLTIIQIKKIHYHTSDAKVRTTTPSSRRLGRCKQHIIR